jgi:hypothetical protein
MKYVRMDREDWEQNWVERVVVPNACRKKKFPLFVRSVFEGY